jgi:histidyl-tRNA synthetase
MLNSSGIEENSQNDALVAIDKLDKIGKNGVIKEFEERGIKIESGSKLLDLFDKINEVNNAKRFDETDFPAQTKNAVILNRLREFIAPSDTEDAEIKDLSKILVITEEQNVNDFIQIDPSLARGLSYYTGAIFEIVLTDGDFAGSIGGGGRYDGLIGMFGKEQIPACGFSLGLERILVVMNERGMFPAELDANAADVVVTVWSAESIGESLKLASELRKVGLRVLVYPETDKLGKQFKYAAQINASFVCVVGESELAENTVTLKNLRTGEQQSVERDKLSKEHFT